MCERGSGMTQAGPKLAEELDKFDDVLDRAKQACRGLADDATPGRTSEAHSAPHPGITFQDAFQLVAKREEDRRKSSKHDSKNKKKAVSEQTQFRGTSIGHDPEVSAFWMVMEVINRPQVFVMTLCTVVRRAMRALATCIRAADLFTSMGMNSLLAVQDYCRPVEGADIQLLLPQHRSFAEDPSFSMPPLGFNPTRDEHLESDEAHEQSQAAEAVDPAHAPTVRFCRHQHASHNFKCQCVYSNGCLPIWHAWGAFLARASCER